MVAWNSTILISASLFFLLRAVPLIAAAEPVTPVENAIDVDRVEQGTVYFRAPSGAETPRPVKTDLHELRYLGALHDPGGSTPYFLFTGRPCENCAQSSAVYALRPTTGALAHTLTSFVYPGKVLEAKTRAVLLDSRAFFGRCLYREKSDVYVVFQKERVDRRRSLQQSVFIAEPGPEHLDERLLERGLPRLQDTLKLVRAKQCRELDGRNRLMLRKPLDLTPRRGTDRDDDDEDDDPPPKENQTDSELSPPPQTAARPVKTSVTLGTPSSAPTSAPPISDR
ncbi:MAG: hypothetical protein A2428_18015 [Bdellovibrionales bacterium RIFOXYC1_FULL_54_43]|nr:MAG: hypothetical protein A2428_18015 [Bdellovibrionales bacterium RIFOXYC1_FULL_54_43]